MLSFLKSRSSGSAEIVALALADAVPVEGVFWEVEDVGVAADVTGRAGKLGWAGKELPACRISRRS